MKNVKKITGVLMIIFLLVGGLVAAQDRTINAESVTENS